MTFRFWSAALSASISSSPHAAVGPAAFPGACGGRPARGVGGFLIAEALLSFAPVAVLGSAIGWPAVAAQAGETRLALVSVDREMTFVLGLRGRYESAGRRLTEDPHPPRPSGRAGFLD